MSRPKKMKMKQENGSPAVETSSGWQQREWIIIRHQDGTWILNRVFLNKKHANRERSSLELLGAISHNDTRIVRATISWNFEHCATKRKVLEQVV